MVGNGWTCCCETRLQNSDMVVAITGHFTELGNVSWIDENIANYCLHDIEQPVLPHQLQADDQSTRRLRRLEDVGSIMYMYIDMWLQRSG